MLYDTVRTTLAKHTGSRVPEFDIGFQRVDFDLGVARVELMSPSPASELLTPHSQAAPVARRSFRALAALNAPTAFTVEYVLVAESSTVARWTGLDNLTMHCVEVMNLVDMYYRRLKVTGGVRVVFKTLVVWDVDQVSMFAGVAC